MNCKPCNFQHFCVLAALIFCASLAQAADNEIEARLARIEAMPPAEKADLLKNHERFSQLTPAEQEKLRTLAAKVENASDADRLKMIMQQYTQWLATLSVGQRAELRSLPTQERMQRIRELVSAQQREEVKRLINVQVTEKDLEHLRDFAKDYIASNIDEFTKLVPREMLPRLGRMNSEERGKVVLFSIGRHIDRFEFPAPNDEKLKELKSKLSKPAAKAFSKVEQPREQTRLVLTWLRTAAFARFHRPPSDEELKEFYTSKLSPEQREELDGLSVEDSKRKLLEFYRHYTLRRRWNGQRPGGGQTGGPSRGGSRPPGGPGRPGGGPPQRDRNGGDRGDAPPSP